MYRGAAPRSEDGLKHDAFFHKSAIGFAGKNRARVSSDSGGTDTTLDAHQAQLRV